MPVEVLLNAGAGTVAAGATGPDAVRAALASAGVDANVRAVPGKKLHTEAKAAVQRGADAVVAAGGDGTVSAVAGALAGGSTPLGVLAIGTLNHFAKDAGLPLDLAAAARTIAARHVERLDVARLGDRVFVNNSSVGVYAHALIDRDARREHGWNKWPAMAAAVLKIFNRHPLIKVRLEVDGRPLFRKTPLIFVGNNCYELDLMHIGKRACLADGALSLYIANTSSRWGMLKLAVRAAFGRLEQSRDFESLRATEIRIETTHRHLHVALDGEVTTLTPPLLYKIWPKSLAVIVPHPNGNQPASLLNPEP
jgi:diacylglycerol kinase family enzyme